MRLFIRSPGNGVWAIRRKSPQEDPWSTTQVLSNAVTNWSGSPPGLRLKMPQRLKPGVIIIVDS
jgi:hypothetical protein